LCWHIISSTLCRNEPQSRHTGNDDGGRGFIVLCAVSLLILSHGLAVCASYHLYLMEKVKEKEKYEGSIKATHYLLNWQFGIASCGFVFCIASVLPALFVVNDTVALACLLNAAYCLILSGLFVHECKKSNDILNDLMERESKGLGYSNNYGTQPTSVSNNNCPPPPYSGFNTGSGVNVQPSAPPYPQTFNL
jgi:hypothetical protein